MNRVALMFAAGTAMFPAIAVAEGLKLSPVPHAMPKAEGVIMPSQLSPELIQIPVAQGFMAIENPAKLITHFGFAGDGPMLPAANSAQDKDNLVEATKTEPDKNTYLVLLGQSGPDANYNYGTHFLFQGHESGPKGEDGKAQGALTRINLDADLAHRVTLMADGTIDGAALPLIDGSTWDPFADRLLLTSEEGTEGGVWQATVDFPSKVESLTGIFGNASYEGIQVASDGSIWIVEDEGGKVGELAKHAKQPNSFLYRLVPNDRTDLMKGGRLEALQIMDASGQPITFHSGRMDDDIKSQGMKDIHAYGAKLKTKWILLHDTEKNGTAPFDANNAAKSAGATPLKRPENGLFRPGSNFTEFVFDETGDTNADTEAEAGYGGFGGVLKLTQASPGAVEGELTILYRGDRAHTGFDNCAFWSADEILFVEDAGDGLHAKRNALDSGYVVDLSADYSRDGTEPVRFLAEGRDGLATIDSGLSALKDTGFQNEGDNEITGVHVSDGDRTPEGLLGAKIPTPFENGWRVFYTQQHGENTAWELLQKASGMKTAAQ
ncbi:MAG: alkaline phosphatase PhoX [Hyphomicrobiales bacterium]